MSIPLAEKIRPVELDEICGQEHILGEGKVLRKIIESGNIPNMIFYGPSGVGKTTVASIIAKKTDKYFCKLNGTSASTSDIKDLISKIDTMETINGILLYLDEIQYFTKKQQQTLLEFIENGSITLIASTTENPYFYVYNALLSRSTVFEFKSVEARDILKAVKRAFKCLEKEKNEIIKIEDGAEEYISTACGGDVRKALNAVELAELTGTRNGNTVEISIELVKDLTQKSALRYDKDGDEHYDIISAFQKSMRGSDPDAAIHYLSRLLTAGDLPSVCRRLMVCACEDVGLAWPQIIPIVKSCVDAALMVGLPEAQIPLGDAVILVSLAPKSNSGCVAVEKAMKDVSDGIVGQIPRNLQNKHYDSSEVENKGQHYLYPHSYPNHWIKQQYLPDNMINVRYYDFGDNKTENAFKEYWKKISGSKYSGEENE
jgi:putative ATPase